MDETTRQSPNRKPRREDDSKRRDMIGKRKDKGNRRPMSLGRRDVTDPSVRPLPDVVEQEKRGKGRHGGQTKSSSPRRREARSEGCAIRTGSGKRYVVPLFNA
jgi:hypothetical protein